MIRCTEGTTDPAPKEYVGTDATRLAMALQQFGRWSTIFKLTVTALLIAYVVVIAWFYDRANRIAVEQGSEANTNANGIAGGGTNLPEFIHRILFGTTNGVVGVIVQLWYSALIMFSLTTLLVWVSVTMTKQSGPRGA